MRIEFFTTSAMEVAHYAPVIRALRAMKHDAVFVSNQRNFKSETVGVDDKEVIDATIKKTGLPLAHEAYINADAVVTIQAVEHVALYRGVKIRMQYGVGLVAPERQIQGGAFDYHLVHGPFGQRVQFSQHSSSSPNLPPGRVRVIGYPKFDEWFQGEGRFWPSNNIGTKNILLWLPTWGEKSSITRFTHPIFDLSDKYDIWVRPHHCSVFWEKERVEYLKKGPVRVLDFTEPPESSYAAASLVLADLSSGAFSEAAFLSKPVIGLTSHEEERRLLHSFVPYPLAAEICQLSWMVDLKNPDLIERQRFRYDIIQTTNGADGKRAAHAIIECAMNHRERVSA